MIQLFLRGRLETVDIASLGIHTRHDVLDRTVLSCSVQGLEDHQKGVSISGVQYILFDGQSFHIFFELRQSFFFSLETSGVLRVEIFAQ